MQELFSELIEKGRFAHADPGRGRFRTWLLGALKFRLSHQRERRRAAKRGGTVQHLALDREDGERRWSELAAQDLAPDVVFDRAWALAVLQRAYAALERSYERAGKASLLAALHPSLLGDSTSENLRTLASRLGMSPGAAKTAAFRLRRALRAAIREELATTLDDPRDIEDEIAILFTALSRESL